MWAETSLKVYYVLSDFILTKLICNPLYGLQVPTDGIKNENVMRNSEYMFQ